MRLSTPSMPGISGDIYVHHSSFLNANQPITHCHSEVAAKYTAYKVYSVQHIEIGFYSPKRRHWLLMKGMKCSRHAVMASYPAELTTDIPEHSFLDSGKIQSAE